MRQHFDETTPPLFGKELHGKAHAAVNPLENGTIFAVSPEGQLTYRNQAYWGKGQPNLCIFTSNTPCHL